MQRRFFLRLSSYFSVGLFSIGPNWVEGKKISQFGIRMEGIAIHPIEKLDEFLDSIKKAGFRFIELYPFPTGFFLGMPSSDFFSLLKKKNLKPISCQLKYGEGENSEDKNPTLIFGLEPFAKDFAAAGGKYIVCGSVPQFARKSWADYEIIAANLNKAGSICTAAGIQLCYRPGDYDFDTSNDNIPLHFLLNSCDKEKVKIQLDLGPFLRRKQNLEWYAREFPGRFPLALLTDVDLSSGKNVPFGKGDTNFKSIFSIEKQAGFIHYFLEPINPQKPDLKSLEEGISFLKTIRY